MVMATQMISATNAFRRDGKFDISPPQRSGWIKDSHLWRQSLTRAQPRVNSEIATGRLVAHTPVPLPHSRFRAQISLEFSMVYAVYTLSMGTYWVQAR